MDRLSIIYILGIYLPILLSDRDTKSW